MNNHTKLKPPLRYELNGGKTKKERAISSMAAYILYATAPDAVNIPLTGFLEDLLGHIRRCTRKRGYCRAKNAYFMKQYGVTERTVTRWIDSLVTAGRIWMERVGNERHIYVYPVTTRRRSPRACVSESKQPTEVTEETTSKQAAPEQYDPDVVVLEMFNSAAEGAATQSAGGDEGEAAVRKCGVEGVQGEETAVSAELVSASGISPDPQGYRPSVQLHLTPHHTKLLPPSKLDAPSVASAGTGGLPVLNFPHKGSAVPSEGSSRSAIGVPKQTGTIIPHHPTTTQEGERNADGRTNSETGRCGNIDAECKVSSRRSQRQSAIFRGQRAVEQHRSALTRNNNRIGDGDEGNELDSLTAENVPAATALAWITLYGLPRVRVCVDYLKQTRAKGHHVPSPGGFLRRCLEAGWHFKLCDRTPQEIAQKAQKARTGEEGRRGYHLATAEEIEAKRQAIEAQKESGRQAFLLWQASKGKQAEGVYAI
jgi:hypothetical protein